MTTRALGLCLATFTSAVSAQLPRVAIETDVGRITIEVDTIRAPVTASNFLRYVDDGVYAGGAFYRAVREDNQPDNDIKIDVIQGGISRSSRSMRRSPIALERTSVTGLTHGAGTVSMARAGPDTASTEFFICIENEPELDYGGRRHTDGQGFAAFGWVVEGMDVVRMIHRRPVRAQRLDPSVGIQTVQRTNQNTAR